MSSPSANGHATAQHSAAGGQSTSPATAPALPDPAAQACLTPPSVRRREARIARCAYVAPSRAGGGRDAVGTGGDGDGAVRDTGRREYGAEEVEARRVGRRAAERQGWQGWEREAERYAGPVVDPGGLVRADGTVDWDALPPAGAGGADLPEVALPRFQATTPPPLLLNDAPAARVDPPARLTLPSLPTAPAQLPANTLPLVLSALFIAYRAYTGARSGAAPSGTGEKRRRGAFERDWRE
ncbi:hypothetical protein JCM10207_002047 [Rhodosporidiobolus poonsookiae]